MIQELITWAGERGDLLYLVVFLLVLGESALMLDLFVPGEVGLVLASAAVRSADGSLGLVIAVASAGAVVGDSISYWLGRRFGPELVNRWRFTLVAGSDRPSSAPDALRAPGRHGSVRGRWVGALPHGRAGGGGCGRHALHPLRRLGPPHGRHVGDHGGVRRLVPR